ncbi:hypothetical protein K3G63_03800 [Hymenobacter sp. HSC-4F20]|uniref:hypothetical protein n=1 Tax=Hymenobacter sp. HSC-4F20 TaxID=2864135 RepID=UPI001C73C353|nr:hypothetical protein [Hymenobacter sp. HSC-4F20]MBX0289545.1 hypothetical protein [Hymenobacter sp. HSC-4F20]
MKETFTQFPVFTGASFLTRQQRAWVALYSLSAGRSDRSEILRQNAVTEADLAEFIDSWLRLRSRTAMRM